MANKMTNSNIDQYYVIGHPVKHSLSPKIHRQFAEQTGQVMRYDILDIAPDNLKDTFSKLKENPQVKGLSVTVPYKEKVFAMANLCDEYANDAQAVSNIIFTEDRKAKGLNLDGVGLVKSIRDYEGISLTGKRILVIGAGGAVKGSLAAIIAEQPASITLTNRTLAKAEELAVRYQPQFSNIDARPSEALLEPYDLIINATSASITGAVPNVPTSIFHPHSFAYDLMYAPQGTAFTHWCAAQDIRAVDGKGMLLALSQEIFTLWRGVTPDISHIQL